VLAKVEFGTLAREVDFTAPTKESAMDDRSNRVAPPTHLSRLNEEAAPKVVAIKSRRAASGGFVWRKGLIVATDEALALPPL
jgi:hypothetical protein